MEKKIHNHSSINEEVKMDRNKGIRFKLISFISGIIVGMVLLGIGGWLLMPSMMLTSHQSRYNSVDETCTHIKMAIEANGWECPAIRNMNKSMVKHGVQMDAQVRIVELCKAKYAKDVLMTDPEVSTLMPCAWGVYEGKDGNIYISGMNMGLMGKIFGGNIAKVMGGAVSKDEERILKEVIR
ncbi:MAG: DUF302 domain-containing protein [Bacteroidota bacterium]|nr:DUF302 domain-containing protein [Bacteroidota bacterium]